uniref:Putative D-(-)-3-hydroxybutyrate oligomer hydrolase n=1 Tax=Caulobacter sp. (strain K31) TaxID=366602 RepID=B0T3V3_CAUSK
MADAKSASRLRRWTRLAGLAVSTLAVAASTSFVDAAPASLAKPPTWLELGPRTRHDGPADDLTGLAAKPGPYADPLHPTAAELRRQTMASTFDSAAGWGRLLGPTINVATGQPYPDGGRVSGEEQLAYARVDGAVSAMLLQTPRSLSRTQRCIVAVPVAGSFSLYHDINTLGYWGLQHGCAVVYTDKGHGDGVHDLDTDTVNLIDGTRAAAKVAGKASHFTADLSEARRRVFVKQWPHRIAFKASHSKRNPESRWGEDVLNAIRFAFWRLNADDGGGWTPANTLVIVTGASNGGGATLYAGEADTDGLIDAVVAAEPQVQLRPDPAVSVARGKTVRQGVGRTLLDYFTYFNLYGPCAVLATPDAPWAGQVTRASERCGSLRLAGLLSAEAVPAQAAEALARLRDYGFDPETDILHAASYMIGPDATAAKYANDHGRFGVEDRLCGYSFASVDAQGVPRAVPPAELAEIFAKAAGGAPSGSIDIVNDDDPRGPRRNSLSMSPSNGRLDYNFDGARCLRELAVGSSANARRVQAGIAEFAAKGDLHGKPAIIVHGRADDRVPAAFSSRPYLGLNSLREGAGSQLRYIEVEHAEHFGFSAPGFDTRFVPLTYYHLQALDWMWGRLTTGAALPASQIVRTTPRGGAPGSAPPLSLANIPPLVEKPAAADTISVHRGYVALPD